MKLQKHIHHLWIGSVFLILLGQNLIGQTNDQSIRLVSNNETQERIHLGSVIFQMAEVQAAERMVTVARLEVERLSSFLNPSITLNPSARFTDEQVTLNASLSGSINLGRSTDVQNRLTQAQFALGLSELQLSQTLNDSLLRLSRGYFAAVLAVQELAIAEQELQVAQARLLLDQGRFERGELSFLEISRTDQDFQVKINALQDAQRKAEISLEDLFLLVPNASLVESAQAGYLPTELSPLDPDQVLDQIVHTHPEILRQVVQVQSARDRLTNSSSSPVSLTVRTGLDLDGHSLGLSYNLSTTSLGLSYGIPSIQLGNQPQSSSSSSGSSSTTPLWTVTASASIGIQPDVTSSVQRETNLLNLEREEQRLESLIQSTELGIHRTWVDLQRAQQAVTQQEQGLERAWFLYSVVETRRELGIVGDLDVSEAQLAIKRAEFNLLRARILLEQQTYIYSNQIGLLDTHIFRGVTQ